MPTLAIRVSHALSQAEARQRVQRCLRHLRRQLDKTVGPFEVSENANTFAFRGKSRLLKVTGQLFLADGFVRLEVTAPSSTLSLVRHPMRIAETTLRQLLH